MRPGEPPPYEPSLIADGALGAGKILADIEENEMRNRPVAAPSRKSIVPSVVLAGLTSFALLGHIESVSAATMNACHIKHSQCFERCVSNNPGTSTDPETKRGRCVVGTCDHQYKACSGEKGPPDYTKLDPPKGTRPIVDRSPSGPRPGGGVGGGRPGGGVGVGGRPGRDAGNVRDHRRGGGRGRIIHRVKTPSPPVDQVQLPSGGILDNTGGGFGQQGPAATGSPVSSGGSRTPSGPVIIR
jgi:hypothetical protein